MLKHFLAILLLVAVSFSAAAAEKVPGVWGWIPTSTQGSYFRAILEEANRNQDKYEFVFENRPGAGASIAARHVLAQPGTAVFANSWFALALATAVFKEAGSASACVWEV